MDIFRTRKNSDSNLAASLNADGFDSFDVSLGDLMRGERATMGKSLLDVEKELKIKATYISAIENTDPNAFETPGFIAGYVRSYARYLGLDPDQTFDAFCKESGFQTAHGMSTGASNRRPNERKISDSASADKYDAIFKPGTPFLPEEEGFLAKIEPGALGSSVVLLALIAVIGYGGWSVLNEVQKVRVAPVENAPEVLSDLDPITSRDPQNADGETQLTEAELNEQSERLDRLYRPQALDVPVMIARDGPISTLDPATVGTLPSNTNPPSVIQNASVGTPPMAVPTSNNFEQLSTITQNVVGALTAATQTDAQPPQVVEAGRPELRVVAVRPSWVQIRAADNTVLFEGVMNAGTQFDVPQTEEPAEMKVGESGSVYFEMGGKIFGPAGPRGAVTSKIGLSVDEIGTKYSEAKLEDDKDLSSYLAKLEPQAMSEQIQQ